MDKHKKQRAEDGQKGKDKKQPKNMLQCMFCLKKFWKLACVHFPFGIPMKYYTDEEDCPYYKDPEKGVKGHLRLVKK